MCFGARGGVGCLFGVFGCTSWLAGSIMLQLSPAGKGVLCPLLKYLFSVYYTVLGRGDEMVSKTDVSLSSGYRAQPRGWETKKKVLG